MANIQAIITAVGSPSVGWYGAKIKTNPSITVYAVSLKATKFSLGQLVSVIQYRNWTASPEFGFVESGAYQSIVYAAPQNIDAIVTNNPNNTALSYIANTIGNVKMLYHPAIVNAVNSTTLTVTDRVSGQTLTLPVANVNAQDFKVGFGCLIQVATSTIIGFWRSVPDYVLPDTGTGKLAQVGYNLERNFIIGTVPFYVRFGSYISYRTSTGYFVWDAIRESGYNVPSDPLGDGNYIHNPSITMMSPTSKYIYPEMTNAAKTYNYRRRFNRETQSFEDNGGLFVISSQRQYSDCQYVLQVGTSTKWELCDWDGTNPVDVDSRVLAFQARYQTAGGIVDYDSQRLFVMNDQPILLARIFYGGSSSFSATHYTLSAVNVLNGAMYTSATYTITTGGVGAWCNEGHTDTDYDRYYFYAGNRRIRIDPTSLGTSGSWSDALPIPFNVWIRPMSASTGLVNPEGEEFEPWFEGQVLRNGAWLTCFPSTGGGTFYQTAPKENHIYSEY